jgi:hypothetical protein
VLREPQAQGHRCPRRRRRDLRCHFQGTALLITKHKQEDQLNLETDLSIYIYHAICDL